MKCKKLAPTCLYHLNTLTAKTDSDHPDVPVLEKRQVSRGKWNWWCSSEDHVTDPIRDSAVSEGGHFPVASGTDDAGAAIWVNCLVLHRRMLSSKQCNFELIHTIFLKIICSKEHCITTGHNKFMTPRSPMQLSSIFHLVFHNSCTSQLGNSGRSEIGVMAFFPIWSVHYSMICSWALVI